jgi:hypothetical protein
MPVVFTDNVPLSTGIAGNLEIGLDEWMTADPLDETHLELGGCPPPTNERWVWQIVEYCHDALKARNTGIGIEANQKPLQTRVCVRSL